MDPRVTLNILNVSPRAPGAATAGMPAAGGPAAPAVRWTGTPTAQITPPRGPTGILRQPTFPNPQPTGPNPYAAARTRGSAQPPAATPQRHAPNNKDPTLQNALRAAMLDQSTVSNIVDDFTVQPGKPAHPSTFRAWLAGGKE